MPYIKKERRFNSLLPMNAGELNYLFTTAAIRYLSRKGVSYQHLNDIFGALEGCKLELYRRVAVSYEVSKIQENGDVYPAQLPTVDAVQAAKVLKEVQAAGLAPALDELKHPEAIEKALAENEAEYNDIMKDIPWEDKS